jgi:hypothetical protein
VEYIQQFGERADTLEKQTVVLAAKNADAGNLKTQLLFEEQDKDMAEITGEIPKIVWRES